ncbi:MAG: metallophosphoesterase, partial [Clostridia bacterium]|nr:metallophosphoesterase [Clostridia bacterium]
MKFLLFSDLHHFPGDLMSGTDAQLDAILTHAAQAGVDFIIHAGDFCHGLTSPETPAFIERYNACGIPAYHVLGNHDADFTPLAEMLLRYKMPAPYYYFDCKGYRFIATDTNYFYEDGHYVHCEMRNYFGKREQKYCLPPEEIAWLKETIERSPYPCVLISHDSFEREAVGAYNRREVLTIINEANRKKPHSVLLAINGHYHRDHIRILDNVCYFEVCSVGYDWLTVPHNHFPRELCDQYADMPHSLVWNDPLHCIVTLEGSTITIEGMESSYFMGV